MVEVVGAGARVWGYLRLRFPATTSTTAPKALRLQHLEGYQRGTQVASLTGAAVVVVVLVPPRVVVPLLPASSAGGLLRALVIVRVGTCALCEDLRLRGTLTGKSTNRETATVRLRAGTYLYGSTSGGSSSTSRSC